jgi:hypothetical protein
MLRQKAKAYHQHKTGTKQLHESSILKWLENSKIADNRYGSQGPRRLYHRKTYMT